MLAEGRLSVRIAPGILDEIDVLVEAGQYRNRSDFTNKAVEDRLKSHRTPAK